MSLPEIDMVVYPDECDAFGHLNQASFLSLFERARWEMLLRGPGMDVFTQAGTWPALRKTVIDYRAPALPGDVLRFHQALTHLGRTSFTMRQTARRVRDETLIASAEFVFVCIDRDGKPVPVPTEFSDYTQARREVTGDVRRLMVRGVNLALEMRGEGPPVLFVHGYPFNHTIWRDQIDSLDGFRRIAPDLRGMGQSDAPDLGYGLEIYAADLAALLDALAVDQVVLCGLSMGGYIAFEFLRQWRSRVRGLVLMDTRSEADSAEARRARDAAAAVARERGAGAIAEAMLPKVLAPTTLKQRPDLSDQIREMMAATPVAGIVGALAAMRDRPGSEALLPTLADLPTLVIVGEADDLTPPDQAKAMAQAIPGARFVTIPGAGHVPPVEQPGATTRELRIFLESIQ
ncbi:MAG TPA: alpha/beta fold hydrolase [Gemmatimonadales bacterium]|jgi:YbgC/YbaW family acyl-CoA thioester hydrolase|nr:alpha/beta fold hydrolase [Gemmatimonadales bacterium]